MIDDQNLPPFLRLRLWHRDLWPKEIISCEYCGVSNDFCRNCGHSVPIGKVVDMFHVGECYNCRAAMAEPCYVRAQNE